MVEARAKLVGLGARVVEDPGGQRIAAFLPISAATYQQIAPALLPLWLEMTAPLLLSIGLAPSRRLAEPIQAQEADQSKAVNLSAVIPLRRSN